VPMRMPVPVFLEHCRA